jgi:hypothetical protein
MEHEFSLEAIRKRTDMTFDVAMNELMPVFVSLLGRRFSVKETGRSPDTWDVAYRYTANTASDSNAVKSLWHDAVYSVIDAWDKVTLPESWISTLTQGLGGPVLVPLDVSDREYAAAAECFSQQDSATLADFPANIVSIHRVQNPILYRGYVKNKRVIASLCNGDPNELVLKHGTKNTDPMSIWASAFGIHENIKGIDPRFCGDSCFYGRGAYFAEDTAYSHGYAHCLPNGHRQMFLAYVSTGNVDFRTQQDRSIIAPRPQHHSVSGPISVTPGVFYRGYVVYEYFQSYPAYLVTYS